MIGDGCTLPRQSLGWGGHGGHGGTWGDIGGRHGGTWGRHGGRNRLMLGRSGISSVVLKDVSISEHRKASYVGRHLKMAFVITGEGEDV